MEYYNYNLNQTCNNNICWSLPSFKLYQLPHLEMPRRLPVRPQVIIGNMFVVLVFWLIGFIYYAYTFLVWLPKIEGKYSYHPLTHLNLLVL